MEYIGIDYGTSNSSVAIYNKSNIIIAPNRIGERTTPSLVLFSENSKDIFIGEEVLDQKLEGKTLIYDVKRFIGLNYDEFKNKEFDKKLNYPVINDGGIPKIKVKFNGEDKLFTAEKISSFIIKKIIYNTEQYLGTSIDKAVLTVPVHFSKSQINSIKKAALEAGIKTSRVIKEPIAAALAYGLGNDLIQDKTNDVFSSVQNDVPKLSDKEKVEENVMIFDLGGGTFDISILNIKKIDGDILNFDVRATNGISNFGGSDFDNKLVDYCIKTFCKKTGKKEEFVRNNVKAFKRLKVKCENAKKVLSISNESIINMDNFDYEEDIPIKITISKFEEICTDLFVQIRKTIEDLFSTYSKQIKDIDSVILIGGATRMPGIKILLKNIFKDENKIKDSINPEEAVSIGAALEAAKIEEKQKVNFILQDIIPFNIGISIANQNPNEINKGDKMYTIIKKYTNIPCESEEHTFKVNLTKEKPDITVNIYEGNNKYVFENSKLGDFLINNINIIGMIEYKLKFYVDINSKLSVTLKIDSLQITRKKDIESDVTHALLDKEKKKISICKSKGLNTIKSIIEDINNFKFNIKNSEGKKKIENLIECSKKYEELISYYMKLSNNNDFIYEKIFLTTKELFEIYIELFNSKEIAEKDVGEIINKINDLMKNLISFSGYIPSLFNLFSKLGENCKYELYKILDNYLELMIKEANKRKKEIKFKKFYTKLYFENAFFACKTYLDNNETNTIERALINNIKEKYNTIRNELKQINSFAILIEDLAKEKKFLFGSTGYTNIIKEIEKLRNPEQIKKEDLENLLDLFQNMANTYHFNQRNIGQAYCLANIIKINYKILQNKNLEKLNHYIEKLKIIMSGRENEKYDWYNEVKNIIEEIEKKNFNQ